MKIEDDVLTGQVRETTGELLAGADSLKGLAHSLEGFCDLSSRAAPEDIRNAAVAIRAMAVHALFTAATVVGLSERLNVVTAVLESAVAADDAPPSGS